MSSRRTAPNIPNLGGSGRIRGNAREDGPINTLNDIYRTASPHWHERIAGRALSHATGIPWDIADSIIEAVNVLISQDETPAQIRARLNPNPFGRLRADAEQGAARGLRETIAREFGA